MTAVSRRLAAGSLLLQQRPAARSGSQWGGREEGGGWRAHAPCSSTHREERLVLAVDVVRRARGGGHVVHDAAARLGNRLAAPLVQVARHHHAVGLRLLREGVEARVARLRGGGVRREGRKDSVLQLVLGVEQSGC